MQVIFNLFNLIFFGPIVNLLVFILRFFEGLHIPGALGWSIIILTIFIRLLVWPFMNTQLKSAKKMADLKPHLDELKKKHSQDKQALASAQMALYKEHGVNPAGGCLPALIQIPVLIALYQTILSFFSGPHGLERINNVLYFENWHLSAPPSPYFLGIDLSSKPNQFMSHGYVLLLIPVLTALMQFILSRMTMPKPVKTYPSDSPKEKKEKAETEDAMAAVQGQMAYLMPIMIGYFAFSLPVALSLYWNVLNIVSIFQQYTISGWGSLKDLIDQLPLKKS